MDSSWTTWSGPAWEFLLPAVAVPPRSRGRSLVGTLREAIRAGWLAPGTRLPSSRDLAADLRVSRGLVTEVYAQLIAESYLVSRPGAGTWVAELSARPAGPAPAAHPDPNPDPNPDSHPSPADPRFQRAAPDQVTDFRPGVPALSLFPRVAWTASYQRAVAELPAEGLGYPDPRGLPELRVVLAELLARRRGVAVRAEGVLVCSGVAQAITLLAQVAAAHGHRSAAVEDPGSPGETSLLENAGLAVRAVPLDAAGVDLRALAESDAGLFVATPAHQFPTGIAYTPERRAALLAWARARSGLILEDDYDGEFRYDRSPVGALQGLAPDLVAYTGSVSKSLAPGLRLGWLVPPAGLLDELVEAKRMTDLGCPVPDQAALADFIRTGRYDRQLRRCQRAYRDRRDTLRTVLEHELPDVRILGIAAGLHVIAEFPARYGAAPDLVERARSAGVELYPVGSYQIGPGPLEASGTTPARIVLGYANLTPRQIAVGIRALADTVGTQRVHRVPTIG
ncbi:MAG TPA: PLP-dependent aminotransferase family protein [Actinocrinis sp.]|jgi:GntR family transcriptional regulator/MocR family aminotransferase